jgi:hypothetical protein
MFSDDALPTWLHTLLCIAIVTPFGLPLLFYGGQALTTLHLEPLSGPEFGQFFFGNNSLSGTPAQVAGVALFAYGLAFFTLGVSFTRQAETRPLLRWLPWLMLAAGVTATFLVKTGT